MGLFSDLRRYLFDFSASEQEQKELEQILRAALSESATDDQFRKNFRRRLSRGDAQQTRMRWAFLAKLMAEYRRMGEVTGNHRVLAQRLLEDLPRRYGRQNEASTGRSVPR